MLSEILLAVLTIAILGILFYFAQLRTEIIKFLHSRNDFGISPSNSDQVIKQDAFADNNDVVASKQETQQATQILPLAQTEPIICEVTAPTDHSLPSNIPYGAVPKGKTQIFTKFSNFLFGKSTKLNCQVQKIDLHLKLSNQKLKKEILKNIPRCPDSPGSMYIYKLEMKVIFEDSRSQVRKCEMGTSCTGNYIRKERVIMILGATGSGKTTLINSMLNYVLGVEYNDPFRFKLITEEGEGRSQAFSQTSWITAYTIHHQEGFMIPYTLTIIDTPGFGDSAGINRDMEITKQIHKFFTVSGHDGIDRIDAVGFVIQSSLPRLTPPQMYIFDQILSLFGKDIGENIYLMLTFADGKQPQVLNGIHEAGLPYQEYFKFNNSVIFEEYLSGDEFDKMFWKMGMQSFDNFFGHFYKIQPKSLTQTKSVLEERERIETEVVGLQFEINRGLHKLEQLKKEVEVVLHHKAEIARNENFTYTVEEEAAVKHELEPGTFVTNCLTCNYTCHNPCSISADDKKFKCAAMARKKKDPSDVHCRICPQKCFWKQHKNMQFYYTTMLTDVTKTSQELKERFHDANGKMIEAREIVEIMTDEFEAVQIKVIGITEILRKSITKLNEIALKPTPLSTPEYIDILIESERASSRPGWQQRVHGLYEVKEKVNSLVSIAKQGYDPFEEYKKKIKEEKKTKKGIWCAVGEFLEKIEFWKYY